MTTPRAILGTPELQHIPELIQVEQKAWNLGGENLEASEDKIRQRIAVFREGITIALVKNGLSEEVAGSQYAFKIDWDGDPKSLTSWDEYTADGWYHKTHKEDGNSGFLVGVGVVPKFRGMKFLHDLRWKTRLKISELLIARTLDNLFANGVKQVIGNARIPAYHTKPKVPVAEYCTYTRADGKLYDPVLRFHVNMGAEILKPVEYSMADPDSLDAGCWVIYKSTFENNAR